MKTTYLSGISAIAIVASVHCMAEFGQHPGAGFDVHSDLNLGPADLGGGGSSATDEKIIGQSSVNIGGDVRKVAASMSRSDLDTLENNSAAAGLSADFVDTHLGGDPDDGSRHIAHSPID